MTVSRSALSQIFAVSVLVCASGCAVQKAGPNAEAAAPPVVAQKAAPPPPATKPTLGDEAGAVAANKVQIVFEKGHATLDADANKKLDLAARLFRDAHPVLMFTTGYSDRSGDEYANLLLSARRAEAVKRGLVARGIPADRLLIQALGESEPADDNDPNAAANRRVTITWRLL